MEQRWYLAIDLKSFYASVECVERGLDPLNTHLVVADRSRTEKTICLAVSPSLKGYGIPGRARLFEVVEAIKGVNARRCMNAPGHKLTGRSCLLSELEAHPAWEAEYIVAPPQMRKYMAYSGRIYGIYLRYVAPEDIHVYSIDEVFIDATAYLPALSLSAQELAERIMADIFRETGITATAGVGTNLYLAKVAMDILAKHARPNEQGVRLAVLTETTYRQTLWNHRPLTDFWRIGPGYARRLASRGVYTMGELARMSLQQEDALYRIFGVNAELLIDHAWGYEPCTMAHIKSYVPENKSLCSGQVLMRPYGFGEGCLVAKEMGESLSLDLADKGLLAGEISLQVSYDTENVTQAYEGPLVTDHYGRPMPKPVHGSRRFEEPTDSTGEIAGAVEEIYKAIVDERLTVRRFQVAVGRLVKREEAGGCRQLSLFSDPEAEEQQRQARRRQRQRQQREQRAVLDIRKRFGGNAIVKAMDLKEEATARLRNDQVGGHKA